jgi:hypothetical protein
MIGNIFVSFYTYYIWQLLINILNIWFNRMRTTYSIPFSYVSVSIRVLVPLVEQELNSHPVFSGVRVVPSLVLCVFLVDRCLSFCHFCVVCSSSIYGF